MPHHVGESHYHNGSLKERTRRARKTRGQKVQSRKDKALFVAQRSQHGWA